MALNASELLAHAAEGGRLSVDDAVFLYEQAGTDGLRDAANVVRRRINDPSTVTYLVDRNINYTNVCITDCKFCEFYRRPGDEEAYVLDRDTLGQKIQETVDVGGTRILLQGGHNPDLRMDFYVGMLRWIKERFPSVELNAFSPSEIRNLADLEDMSLEDTLVMLREAGMDGLPGGGGEILDDVIRDRVSPKKQKTEDWLECMRVAQRLGMVTSASQVIGFGEEPVYRFRALERLRSLQDENAAAGRDGFLSFVMWPLKFESRYGHVFGEMKGMKLGAEPEEYLRHIALCRLFLDNFPHVAASWPTMGPEVAMDALSWGADDFGSTMLEENVVSSAGAVHSCITEDAIRGFITQAGFAPQKRNSRYEPLTATSS